MSVPPPPSLIGLYKKLPAKWPLQSEPGVNAEDFWMQAILDQVCNLFGLQRDPAKTGSMEAIRAAGPPYGGSSNHKRAERTVQFIRDATPPTVREFFNQEKAQGMCMEEIGARYMPRFHAADVYSWWIVGKYRQQLGVMQFAEEWLSWFKWWLLQSAYEGPKPAHGPWLHPMIYSGGLRREFAPDPRDTYEYNLHVGKPVNPEKIKGDAPTRGGYPGATDVWLACAAVEYGLNLKKMVPVKPPMSYELIFDPKATSTLSYFPYLKWRPGGGPILVACEVSKQMVQQWLVEEKDQIPGPVWGFDPVRKEVVPKQPQDDD